MSVTLPQYCRAKLNEGKFPLLRVTLSSGVYWLHDDAWGHLDCRCFKTREAAENRFWTVLTQVFDKIV